MITPERISMKTQKTRHWPKKLYWGWFRKDVEFKHDSGRWFFLQLNCRFIGNKTDYGDWHSDNYKI